MKVYVYKKCSTCRKAQEWLDERHIEYDELPIREQPPAQAELKRVAGYLGGVKKLFNTSGGDYKELNLKDRLPHMSDDEAIELLSSRGNLVKRPFVVGKDLGIVGFREAEWQRLFNVD